MTKLKSGERKEVASERVDGTRYNYPWCRDVSFRLQSNWFVQPPDSLAIMHYALTTVIEDMHDADACDTKDKTTTAPRLASRNETATPGLCVYVTVI